MIYREKRKNYFNLYKLFKFFSNHGFFQWSFYFIFLLTVTSFSFFPILQVTYVFFHTQLVWLGLPLLLLRSDDVAVQFKFTLVKVIGVRVRCDLCKS